MYMNCIRTANAIVHLHLDDLDFLMMLKVCNIILYLHMHVYIEWHSKQTL